MMLFVVHLPLAVKPADHTGLALICESTVACSALQRICAMTGLYGSLSLFCLVSLNLLSMAFSLALRSITCRVLHQLSLSPERYCSTLTRLASNQQLSCYSIGPCGSFIGATAMFTWCHGLPSPHFQYLDVIHGGVPNSLSLGSRPK